MSTQETFIAWAENIYFCPGNHAAVSTIRGSLYAELLVKLIFDAIHYYIPYLHHELATNFIITELRKTTRRCYINTEIIPTTQKYNVTLKLYNTSRRAQK